MKALKLELEKYKQLLQQKDYDDNALMKTTVIDINKHQFINQSLSLPTLCF